MQPKHKIAIITSVLLFALLIGTPVYAVDPDMQGLVIDTGSSTETTPKVPAPSALIGVLIGLGSIRGFGLLRKAR